MTNSKYTPGPWIVRPDLSIETGQSGITVAGLVDMPADARLIAAAPAMYEALKGMVSMYDSLNKSNKHDGACPCYHCQARAALAQAEGKP